MAALMLCVIAVHQEPSSGALEGEREWSEGRKEDRPARLCWPLLLPHQLAASIGADAF